MNYFILPTNEICQTLKEAFDDSLNIYPNIDLILNNVLASVTLEKIAYWRVNKLASQYASIVKSIEPSKTEQVSKAVEQVGFTLIHFFEKHKAYRNGYLAYHLINRYGNTLVFEKLDLGEVPKIC